MNYPRAGKFSYLLLFLALSGCASSPQIVSIPVPVKVTPPPILSRPALPIATLPANAGAGEQIVAWALTVEALQYYAAQLEILLDGYR